MEPFPKSDVECKEITDKNDQFKKLLCSLEGSKISTEKKEERFFCQ